MKHTEDELLDIIEKGLIERVKFYMKEGAHMTITTQEAKNVIAKVGARLLAEAATH